MKGLETSGRPTYQVTIAYLYSKFSNTTNCVNLVFDGAQPVDE
jgi:hypothetical protein